MRTSKLRSPRLEGVLIRFTKYLNGPLGGVVMDNLEEGESFVLQTTDYLLRISKRNCKAVVEPIETPLVQK